ncbi:MAG: septum formation initiator family protein [Immundisolibacteraceae bacterium]|nr:septum formation initiator family protein [Immundisolibacteraceae bacterium]
MQRLQFILVLLLVSLQYQLWLGENNRFDSNRMQRDLMGQQEQLAELEARNDRLWAEVTDLRDGTDAYEAIARTELGYIGKDEIFFRVIE